MKKYLVVFVAPVEAYEKMKAEMKNKSPEDQKKEMEAWKDWMENHKDAIVDPGAGVGSAVRVTEGGKVSKVHNEIGGYMVIQAESAEVAAKIFDNSPHFGVMDGAIEIMEMMQM